MRADPDDVRRSAFVEHGPRQLTMVEAGPLAGLTFAVKDLFDIAGFPTGCGNPERLREPAAVATAPSVLAMLGAGATCVGKTHTDEFALGMFGTNPHFGTPINPVAPDRVPGGSSSGSAAAVAAGLADFALGTDTGASVRLPASFCGLYGLRMSFGRVSTAGVMPMAPSFDTVGWLARDAAVLRRVAEVHFGAVADRGGMRFLIARDAFALAVDKVAAPLIAIADDLRGSDVLLYEDGIAPWLDTFGTLQLQDLWATLGAWVTKKGRVVGPRARERVSFASTVPLADAARALTKREAFARRLAGLLGDDGILVLPTAHDVAPYRDAQPPALAAFREKTLALTCVAGLTRLPQLSVPAATVDGCPVGLSFIAGPMGDESLVALAGRLSDRLRGRG
ncbi:MAG: amidase [Hyphomicrobiales bacterium]|nr:amidase [Alphaproteobacteria bacterium]